MLVKIITRHGPSNYGSLLQSIATVRVINKLGHQAEIIDYQRNDERGMGIIRSQLKTKKKYSNPLKKLLYAIIRYPIEMFAQKRFDRMRQSWLPLTERYNRLEQLNKLRADAFMTGSDQVWGPTMSGKYDPAYFLSFVDDNTTKIAYAASFGKTSFSEAIIDEYKKLLRRYNKIAVREDTAVDIIKSWGMDNCIGQVLDPTLLLSAEEWRSIFNLPNTIDGDYILVYFIHGYPEHITYAKRHAKKTKRKILCVNPFFHKAIRGTRFVCCPDVSRFLSLIQNASFMITDSFHGTCFAINMNKQFIELLPLNNTSTRNQSLLSFTGLTNRIVTDYNDFEWEDKSIDYKPVNDLLQHARIDSLSMMKSLLDYPKYEGTID